MSAQRPGTAGAGDFAADLEAAGLPPDEPGTSAVLAALAAPPSAAELAGERAALAMFRVNFGVPAVAHEGAARSRKRGLSTGWRIRIGLAAAVVLTAAGTVGAAYAAALPAPVQHLAYRVLGFAGVPDSQHAGSGPGHAHPGAHPSAPVTGPGAGHASPAPTQPPVGSQTPSSPAPGPSSHAAGQSWRGSIAASQHQIAAGDTATLTAGVTQGGHHLAGATVTLLERPAGQVAWRSEGTVVTSSSGQATVRVSGLRTNADFRFTGEGGAVSPTVTVTVVPAITLQLLSQPRAHRRTALIAKSPFAWPGDVVVLQLESGSTWIDLKTGRLGVHEQRIFLISSRLAAGRTFRVTLPATGRHAESLSGLLTLP